MKTLLTFIILFLWATSAQAAVIETNEWNNLTQANWLNYPDGPQSIDAAPPGGSSPSGGSALRFRFAAGTYSTNTGGGSVEYTPTIGADVYMGFWYKWSTPWTWNPVGTKIFYTTQNGFSVDGVHSDNFYVWVQSTNGTNLTFTQQLWAAPGTQNRYQTSNPVTFALNTWYWIELHCIENTVGVADGLLDMWVNDVQVMHHTNVTYRTSNRQFAHFDHRPLWGGGGGTIPVEQYSWVDHSVLSTTRIGCPVPSACGAPPADTQPPTMPTSLTVQ